MRLSVQLAVVTTVASIAPVLVTGFFAARKSIERTDESTDAIMLRDATGMATFVETWTNAEVSALVGWMVPFELGHKPAIQELLVHAVIRAMPSVQVAVLVDADGFPLVDPVWVDDDLVAAGDPRPPGSAARARAITARLPAIEDQRTPTGRRPAGAIGTPWVPDGGGAPSIPVAAVGPYDDDVVLGAEVSMAEVDALIASQSTPTHAIALLAADGHAILGGAQALVDPARLEPLLATGDGTTFDTDLPDGTPVHGALARVRGTPWTVVVVEPTAIVEQASAEIRRGTLTILGVSSLLAVGVSLVVARSVSGPVQELRDGALALASGDLGRRVGGGSWTRVARGDELGDLMRAFDHMAGTLQTNRAEIDRQRTEIQAFNAELQQRVDDRTRELRAAQDRLVQSGQMAAVAEIGAGMAHELNNPLAAILGLAQVLRMRSRGTPEEAQLARIEEQASRCRDVVAAMLRLSAGEGDPAHAPIVDLRPVLREVVGLVAGPYRQRGVTLELADADAPLQVRIDPVAASRILAQVLNSLRAGLDAGSTLRIAGRVDGDDVIIALTPDRPVAAGAVRDDFLASSMGMWVARRLLTQVGGRVDPPAGDELAWKLVMPRSAA
jgi:two-component system NtrC family sensor kinase